MADFFTVFTAAAVRRLIGGDADDSGSAVLEPSAGQPVMSEPGDCAGQAQLKLAAASQWALGWTSTVGRVACLCQWCLGATAKSG